MYFPETPPNGWKKYPFPKRWPVHPLRNRPASVLEEIAILFRKTSPSVSRPIIQACEHLHAQAFRLDPFCVPSNDVRGCGI